MTKGLGLYIHIPFCVRKCHYCDFLSFGGVNEDVKRQYVEALTDELSQLSEIFDERPQVALDTVYFGGGTPSVLSEELFEQIMTAVRRNYLIKEDAEITVEINPGTVDRKKLERYRHLGVNRISMGLQSIDDRQLVHMGRVHDYNSFESTYSLLRALGFNNISIDVMFGLSGQTMAQWQETLTKVTQLAPEHISAYSLIIEPDTCYEALYEHNQLSLPSEDEEREMFWYGHEKLQEAGYSHYEISNYAKPNRRSRHNGSYWNLTPYIGAGLGASSFYNNTRYKNINDLNTYIEAKGNLDTIREVEQINSPSTNLEEAFFLGLRCLEGIDLNDLEDEYGVEALTPYRAVIKKLVNKKLLIKENNIIRLSKKGTDLSNQVMAEFLL